MSRSATRTRAFGRALCATMLAGAIAMSTSSATGPLPAATLDLDFTLAAGGAPTGDGGSDTGADLHGLVDLAFDPSGNLFLTQNFGNRIRKIALDNTISTVGGGPLGDDGDGGAIQSAAIRNPNGIAFDAVGNMFFADSGNHRVRRIDADTGTVTTWVGNGIADAGAPGDGGLAVDASLVDPYGIEFDAAGNLYIADAGAHVIRKVALDRTITTIAGISGVPGYTNDGGLATEAQLYMPEGLAVDADGNVWFADTNNEAIRRIDAATGVITTVQQWSGMLPFDVEISPATGFVHFTNNSNCTIYAYDPATTNVSISAGASFCGFQNDWGDSYAEPLGWVEGIAFDAEGRLYVADAWNAKVRRIDPVAQTILTIAGKGNTFANGSNAVGAPLSYPRHIAVNAAGEIAAVDDWYAKRIVSVGTNGKIYKLAGNGKFWSECSFYPCDASVMSLTWPWGIAWAANGDVYYSDRSEDRIYRVTNGKLIEFAGHQSGGTLGNGDYGQASYARIDPRGIAIDEDGVGLYIADAGNNRVRYIDRNGIITTLAGNGYPGFAGDGAAAPYAQLWSPSAVAVDSAGNVYVTDNGNRRIRKISAVDGKISTVAGNGSTTFASPGTPATQSGIGVMRSIAVDKTGVYFVADGNLHRVAPDGRLWPLGPTTEWYESIAIRNRTLYAATMSGKIVRTSLLPFSTTGHDFDGDGRGDLFWRNGSTGANTLWRSASNATQTAVATVPIGAWKLAGTGDLDGNGRADVVWRNSTTGANQVWNNGDNKSARSLLGVTNQAWKIVALGDFDGDGQSDLLWRNVANGANVIWRSGNSATQTPVLGVTNLAWQVAAVADFDGDGSDDVLWRNPQTGVNTIWKSGNNATQMTMSTVPGTAWKIAGAGDFDGDGKADVLWRNGSNGTNALWLGANSATPRTVATVADQAWNVQRITDFDGDGRADMFWRNTRTGINAIWRGGNSATTTAVVAVTSLVWNAAPAEPVP